MRDYPIGTFLFWNVSKENTENFRFYEFLKNYHQKNNKHNTKADLFGDEDIIAILDGQQRMTSLYIALVGSIAKKAPYRKLNDGKFIIDTKTIRVPRLHNWKAYENYSLRLLLFPWPSPKSRWQELQ